MRDRIQWAVLGGLLAVSVVSVFTLREISVLGSSFRLDHHRKELAMQTFTEVVTVISDPTRKITVTTTKLDSEQVSDWIARHNAAVTAAKNA